jgi:exoribonuclease R
MQNTTHEGVIMIRGKGVGYLRLPDFEEDITIAPEDTNIALDGDIVEVTLTGKNQYNREAGKITKVISRAREEYIGTVVLQDGLPHLRADSKRIHVLFTLPETVRDKMGMKVAVKMTSWEDPKKRPQGEILEIGRAHV